MVYQVGPKNTAQGDDAQNSAPDRQLKSTFDRFVHQRRVEDGPLHLDRHEIRLRK